MKGALPPALLCAALGFALAFAPRREMIFALVVLALAAGATSLLPMSSVSPGIVLAGLWASVAFTAATAHLRYRANWVAYALALNAGAWAGAMIASSGMPGDLARALPAALVALPAAWLVAQGGAIGVKVVASWLIAVAILAAALPMVATPGYVDDHRG